MPAVQAALKKGTNSETAILRNLRADPVILLFIKCMIKSILNKSILVDALLELKSIIPCLQVIAKKSSIADTIAH